MSHRRTPALLLSMLVALGAAACGPAEEASPARWSAPVSAAPTPPPPPRPTPTSTAEVRGQVKAALVDLTDFHPAITDVTSETTEGFKLAHPCRDSLPSDRKRTAYRERQWKGEQVWIRQYVVGYLTVPGRKLTGELRSALAKCRTYQEPDGVTTTTVVRPKAPLVPADADTVSWCERLVNDDTSYLCTVLVSRGSYVLELNAAEAGDLEKSAKLLTRLHRVAVDPFREAT
ncbi:hypothetical protein GA0074696_5513 [Micromonospora purpureochromogenes]|uniref:PknH-like extracellular domain-containing protein n=1 Tax=Micromonospora purpureochromogenes TaxID=47872 RepID=A0A1C5A7S8_9ACTN|nr:hypothetical protein [Micromonospora purpureochromogenes]SCF41282.1 hypothetical protein GA0074696_5513 [Micromonospora purpureochromogenes]